MCAVAWHEVDINAAVDRGCVASHHVEGRHMPGILKARDNRLRRAHAGRDVGLGPTGGLPCLDHLAHDGENGSKPVILGLEPRDR